MARVDRLADDPDGHLGGRRVRRRYRGPEPSGRPARRRLGRLRQLTVGVGARRPVMRPIATGRPSISRSRAIAVRRRRAGCAERGDIGRPVDRRLRRRPATRLDGRRLVDRRRTRACALRPHWTHYNRRARRWRRGRRRGGGLCRGQGAMVDAHGRVAPLWPSRYTGSIWTFSPVWGAVIISPPPM